MGSSACCESVSAVSTGRGHEGGKWALKPNNDKRIAFAQVRPASPNWGRVSMIRTLPQIRAARLYQAYSRGTDR